MNDRVKGWMLAIGFSAAAYCVLALGAYALVSILFR